MIFFFQIYRPINYPVQVIFSAQRDIEFPKIVLDLNSTFLSCIFNALLGIPHLAHLAMFGALCQIAKYLIFGSMSYLGAVVLTNYFEYTKCTLEHWGYFSSTAIKKLKEAL